MTAQAVFRCDASATLGGGHVMRCLAFAETLEWAGWSCVFTTHKASLDAVPALAQSPYALRMINGKEPMPDGEELVVVDHYDLNADYEKTLRANGRTIVVFDDLADRAHDCDVLLDPTPMRKVDAYYGRVPRDARLLVGSQNAILFGRWRKQRAVTVKRLGTARPLQRILLSMGMTDPLNVTTRVIKALKAAGIDAAIDVVLGAGAPHQAQVREALGRCMTLHIDPNNLADLAARADLAIGAPGTSSFERALLGLPAVLIPVADNQRFIADAFAADGAADVVPLALLDKPQSFAAHIAALAQDGARRADMSQRAAAITDGRGVQRLLAAISGSVTSRFGQAVTLRLAEPGDESWLLNLQGQEGTRRFARHPAIPSAAEHAAWFAGVLEDSERLLMIVDVDGKPSGMVRLDKLPGGAVCFEISIAIDGGRHGEGIGRAALSLVRNLAPAADLIATVNSTNEASIALFLAAGFMPDGHERYRSRAA